MSKDIHIVPAIMPTSFSELKEQSFELFSFTEEVHLDVTDGEFVQRAGWPYVEDEQWAELETCAATACLNTLGAYSVHLMVSQQKSVGELYVRSGAERVIAQYEAFATPEDMRLTLSSWRDAGAKYVGVSVLMDTPLSELIPHADCFDELQIMSIATIGAQGNPFDERAFERIAEARRLFPHTVVSCDGGITLDTVRRIAACGADRIIIGSAIMRSGDKAEAYQTLVVETQGL